MPELGIDEIIQILTGIAIVWYTVDTSIIRRGTTSQAILTPSAKLWDRQNALDQIAVANPEVILALS